MKRLLICFLLLALLIGCGKQQEPVPAVPEQPEPQISEPEQLPEAPTPHLMDAKEPYEESGVLWYLPNKTIEAGRLGSLCLFQDMLLAYGERYADGRTDLHLALLDLETGEMIRETSLTGVGYTFLQIFDDQIAICDEGFGNIYILDEELNQTAGRKIAAEWDFICAGSGGTTGYRFTTDDGIEATNLATGEQAVLLPQARMLSGQRPNGNSVCFYYVDAETKIRHTAALDLESGEITEMPFSSSSMSIAHSSGVWMTAVGGRSDYYIGTDEDPAVFDPGEAYPALLSGPTRLKLYRYEENDAYSSAIYEPDGTFLSGFTIPDGWNLYLDNGVWSAQYGGYLLTCTDHLGDVRLLFWDFSAESIGEDLPVTPLSSLIGEVPEGSAVSQELYDRAAALGEQYGVTINIADRCATTYTDYTAVQNTDYWQISTALDTLESALSAYPDGFFDQLVYSTFTQTEFNLVGALTRSGLPEGEITGFDTFTAFAENLYDKHVLTIDITQSVLEPTIHHELSHVIDDKLAFDAMLRQDALYHEETWADYNPEDFGYVFDYYTIPDAVLNDDYSAYFVDTYARTYPTEDRARTFEYAMAGWDWVFTGQEPLRNKLAYYAACIRDAFDTTGWPDVTTWEQPLHRT